MDCGNRIKPHLDINLIIDNIDRKKKSNSTIHLVDSTVKFEFTKHHDNAQSLDMKTLVC